MSSATTSTTDGYVASPDAAYNAAPNSGGPLGSLSGLSSLGGLASGGLPALPVGDTSGAGSALPGLGSLSGFGTGLPDLLTSLLSGGLPGLNGLPLPGGDPTGSAGLPDLGGLSGLLAGVQPGSGGMTAQSAVPAGDAATAVGGLDSLSGLLGAVPLLGAAAPTLPPLPATSDVVPLDSLLSHGGPLAVASALPGQLLGSLSGGLTTFKV